MNYIKFSERTFRLLEGYNATVSAGKKDLIIRIPFRDTGYPKGSWLFKKLKEKA